MIDTNNGASKAPKEEKVIFSLEDQGDGCAVHVEGRRSAIAAMLGACAKADPRIADYLLTATAAYIALEKGDHVLARQILKLTE